MRSSSNHPRPRRSQRDAFTAIEILIVVVILGITAAVALPMIGDRSDLKLAAASRKVVADLQYAQNLSVATRDPVYVRFDADAYTFCKRSGTALVTMAHPVDRMPFVVTFGDAPSSAALAGVTQPRPDFAGTNVIGFDSVGVPFLFDEAGAVRTAMAGAGTVVLRCGTQERSVVIQPYTGEINVP